MLQALTTGSIPGFVDVILNFDTTVMHDDNILSQFLAAGKRIIFYGDDTWIRMFPNVFRRFDGTTSFFVTDYTEVCCFLMLSEYVCNCSCLLNLDNLILFLSASLYVSKRGAY